MIEIISEKLKQEQILLVQRTKQSLYEGLKYAVSNNRVEDISYHIQKFCEQFAYGVVRSLCGHGVGKELHEDPQVPNYGKRGCGPRLKPGMVMAIEPMINLGTHKVYTADDEWTVITTDHQVSAHFEHTVCIRDHQVQILSDFTATEREEKLNPYLHSSY